MRRFIIFAVAASIAWFVLLKVSACDWLSKLLDGGVWTSATVLGPDCNNHNGVWLAFEVDGKTYKTSVRASDIDRDCHGFKSGEQIALIYLPGDPTINTIGAPASQLESNRRGFGICAILIGLACAFPRKRRGR